MAEDIQKERLQNYIDAEKKTLESQEYTVNGHRNRRADLNQISQGINELMGATTGGRSRRVILRDY